MAFPSSSGTVPITLEAGWEQARALAASIKAQVSAQITQAQSSGLPANQIVNSYALLLASISTFNAIAAIPGIAAYAQAQIGNQAEDIGGEFGTMVASIQSAVSWIAANFPHDNSTPPNLLYVQLNASTGALQYTNFTPSQLTGLVTALQGIVAAIN